MKTTLKLFAVNLLVLFFLLVGLELLLEKINPYERHHSILGRYVQLRETALPNSTFSECPHSIFSRYTEHLEIKDYQVKTDAYGFIRSTELIPEAKTNIVFIGGSTTECRYVDDSLRFPSLVGEILRKEGHAVNTFNAGVERSHSGHSLNAFVNKMVHRDFQVAVLMHGINDLVHLSYNGSYTSDEKTPVRANLVTLARPDFDAPDLYFFRRHGWGIRAEKAFQVLFPRLHYDLLASKVKVVSDQSPLEFGWEKMQPVGEAQYTEYRNNLRSFVALCRANGIQPVLMTQFNRISEREFTENPVYEAYEKRLKESDTSVQSFCESYQKMNELVRHVAVAEDVFLIDLDRTIPKSSDYMYDMVHLHGAGSRSVAAVISKAFPFKVPQGNKARKLEE